MDDPMGSAMHSMESAANIVMRILEMMIQMRKMQLETGTNLSATIKKIAGKETTPQIVAQKLKEAHYIGLKGEITQKQFDRMTKMGINFQLCHSPTKMIGDLKRYSEQLGMAFFVMETTGNQSALYVPEKDMHKFRDIQELMKKKALRDDPGSYIKADTITADKADSIGMYLNAAEIPNLITDNGDGTFDVTVESGYEEAYRTAMANYDEITKTVDNITVALADRAEIEDLTDKDIHIIDSDMINVLSPELKDKAAFITDGKVTAVIADKSLTEEISRLKGESKEAAKTVDNDIEVAFAGNRITMNDILRKDIMEKDSTGERGYIDMDMDTDTEYFFRVPNSLGQKYIYLEKSDVTVSSGKNGSKNYEYTIDPDKEYSLCDRSGKPTERISGEELKGYFHQQWELAKNKDTNVREYYSPQGADHIEIYNHRNNTLVAIGAERGGNADTVRNVLKEQGFNANECEQILRKVSEKVTDREAFAYGTAAAVVTVDSVQDVLKTAKVAEVMKQQGIEPQEGKMLYIANEKEQWVNAFETDVTERDMRKFAEEKGMGETATQKFMLNIQKEFTEKGMELKSETLEATPLKVFNNADEEKNGFKMPDLKVADNGEDIKLIKESVSKDNNIEFAAVNFPKNGELPRLEGEIKNTLGITEPLAIAGIVGALNEQGHLDIPKSPDIHIGESVFNVKQLTSQYVTLEKDGRNMGTIAIADIKKGSLKQSYWEENLLLDKKELAKLSKGIMNGIEKNGKVSPLQGIKEAVAKEKAAKQSKGVEQTAAVSRKAGSR